MKLDERKELLKHRVKLARATGLLMGIKSLLELTDDFDKEALLELIDEILELLK